MYTSRDKIEWERDASYNYYKHGPLSRTVLGQLQVQGLDYAYTLQGWLKGVNGTTVGDGSYDIGKDGLVAGGDAPPVARDIFGFGLHYYDDGDDEIDYKIIGTAGSTGMFARPNNGAFKSLYNGNIAGMSVNNAGLQKADPASTNAMPLFYNYRYDQLNRIVSMQAYQGLTGTNTWTPTAMNDYSEAVSYDPNGNIMSYNRNGINPAKTPPSGYAGGYDMDKLRYKYYYYDASDNKLPYNPVTGVPAGGRATNQLAWVDDELTNDNAYPDDINKQNYTDNYQYDEIGNLVKDKTEGITNINWTVYGKIASIQKGESTISYIYDASGNRVTKTANNKTTVYVRDASGNVMSVYEREGVGAMQQTEVHLYGSSRIGMATLLNKPVTHEDLDGGFGIANLSTFTRGEKLFELSNHLGNVLATVTDRKLQQTSDNTAVAYYMGDVVSAQDYYPGGMLMPGRTFSGGSYRYGFNGKELDKDINNDIYNYGMRISDQRLVRFLSMDPFSKNYADLSPYHFAGNSPIRNLDVDGGEPQDYTQNWIWRPLIDVKSGQRAWSETVDDAQLGVINYSAVYDKETKQHWFINQGNDGQWYYWKANPGEDQTRRIINGNTSNGAWERFQTRNHIEAVKAANDRTLDFGAAAILTAPAALIYGGAAVSFIGTQSLNLVARTYPYWPLIAGAGRTAAEFLDESGGSIGAQNARISNVIEELRVLHIFRKEVGHFIEDTPEARKSLLDVANDAANLLGGDKYGNNWYSKITEEGKQIWTQVRGDKIINGGINDVPREFNSETGLSLLEAPNSKPK